MCVCVVFVPGRVGSPATVRNTQAPCQPPPPRDPLQVTSRASTALLAAAFVGIVPSYISRSVAGSYDNEGVAIFALIFTFYFWVKAVKTGSLLWAMGCALAYFYMVAAWGGYVFIINIIPIYVCVLIVGGRYSARLYTAYSVFYVVGSLLAMQVPFVGFNVIKQAECAASHGAFIFLQGESRSVRSGEGWGWGWGL